MTEFKELKWLKGKLAYERKVYKHLKFFVQTGDKVDWEVIGLALAQAKAEGFKKGLEQRDFDYKAQFEAGKAEGRCEREDEMRETDKKLVRDWDDMKNKYLNSLKSNELVRIEERKQQELLRSESELRLRERILEVIIKEKAEWHELLNEKNLQGKDSDYITGKIDGALALIELIKNLEKP